MYHFNLLLFRNLPTLFGVTQHEISQIMFGKKYLYVQRLLVIDRMLVTDLVKMCNSLHISVSRFITLGENNTYYKDKAKYVIDESIFVPITFSGQRLTRMYGKNSLSGGMSKEKVSKEIGVSTSMFNNWINQKECTMKLSTLINMCNRFGINISEFITDPNEPIPMNDARPEVVSPPALRAMEEVVELRKVIAEDKKTIARLTKENEELRCSVHGYNVASETDERGLYSPLRNWRFNYELLDSLPEIFGTSRKEMMHSLGVANPAVSYNNGNITMEHFIALCNRFHISTRHFFIRQKDTIIHRKDWYVSEPFSPISFRPSTLSDIFGRNSLTGMNLSEVLEKLGYSQMKLTGWRKLEKSTMRVNDMADLCNALKVTPSCFINDANRTISGYSITQAEYFFEENCLLRQKIMRLNEQIKKSHKKKQTGLLLDESVVRTSEE